MSDELSFEASELFRAARFGLSPSTDVLARGRRRIAAALAGAGTLGVASSVAVAKTTSAATTAVVASAIAASIVAGGIAWWRVSHH